MSVADSPGIPRGGRDLVLTAPYNDIDRTRQIIEARHEDLAGIFVEPVMRGLSVAPGFLEGVRDLAVRFCIPLVFDEVITGFRLHPGGAQAYYDVTPDIAVYGKGMGAGYPIGAIAGTEEMMAPFDPSSPEGRRIFALGGYHGNALTAAAALANLTELQRPGVYERFHWYGDRIRAELSELFRRRGLSVQMTGAGPIVEYFFTPEAVTDYRSTLRSDRRLKGLLAQAMPRSGIFGGAGRYNWTTAHGDRELALLMDAVDAALEYLITSL